MHESSLECGCVYVRDWMRVCEREVCMSTNVFVPKRPGMGEHKESSRVPEVEAGWGGLWGARHATNRAFRELKYQHNKI